LDQTKDLEAIKVTASMAVKESQGGVLECAYAADQDDHVIGFAYGTRPSHAAATAAWEGEEEDEDEDSTVTLKICLLLTHTCSGLHTATNNSFWSWDVIWYFQRQFILPEGFPAHPHPGFYHAPDLYEGWIYSSRQFGDIPSLWDYQ
jgi:hypothetical protein